MTSIEIQESGKTVQIPSSWDELSEKQAQRIFRINGQCIRKRATVQEMKIRILYDLLGLSRGLGSPDEQQLQNTVMLCEACLGFLFEQDGHQLRYDTVRNLLPKAGPLHGPADLLQDLTFSEFRHAVTAMQAFLKGKDVSDLDDCVAILYRRRSGKENRAGRRVVPLDSPAFRRDRKTAARLPDWQKNMILVWFCSCVHYLQNGKLTLNGEDVDLALLFKSDGKPSGPAFTWNDMLVQMAKDQILGPMDRVDEEPLFSVLQIMWSNYKESVRHEKIRKAHKNH